MSQSQAVSHCSIQNLSTSQHNRNPINRQARHQYQVLSNEEAFQLKKDNEDLKRAINDLYQRLDSVTASVVEEDERDEYENANYHELLSKLPSEKEIMHALRRMDKEAESLITKLPRLAYIR